MSYDQIIYFFSKFFLLLYSIVLVLPYMNMKLPQGTRVPHPEPPLPPPSLYHHSGSSQCTSPKHPVSSIESGLAIRFLYDSIHVTMPFSQIIPLSPFSPESKRLFYTSVSLLLSRIQGYLYHLSKFRIDALVYCIGVFLSFFMAGQRAVNMLTVALGLLLRAVIQINVPHFNFWGN